jgi:thioredoxin 1
MPTFMIFKSGTVINTIRGADTGGLTTAIESAVKLAGAAAPTFSSQGRTLGGTAPRGGQSLSRPVNYKGFIDAIIAFFGLYFISLFSFDAYAAAENSPFNVNRPAPPPVVKKADGRTGAATQVGKKLGTIADITGGN